MGHESSGEVIAVGELVRTHKVGDRVVSESLDSSIHCGLREGGEECWMLTIVLDSRAGASVQTVCELQGRPDQHLSRSACSIASLMVLPLTML